MIVDISRNLALRCVCKSYEKGLYKLKNFQCRNISVKLWISEQISRPLEVVDEFKIKKSRIREFTILRLDRRTLLSKTDTYRLIPKIKLEWFYSEFSETFLKKSNPKPWKPCGVWRLGRMSGSGEELRVWEHARKGQHLGIVPRVGVGSSCMIVVEETLGLGLNLAVG